MVSTHIYGVSKEIDGKTFIFRVNLGMWPLKSIFSEKTSTVLRVSTHIYGDFEKKDGNIHFERKPRHVTFQNDCLRKMSTVLRVSTHIYSKEIDGKMFIFRVNLGIWHLKSIVLEKRALF